MGELDVSLLERLTVKEKVYEKENGKYNAVVITKLLENYRSHHGLLKLPNDLFYDGELIARSNQTNDKYLRWVSEVTKGKREIPMLFRGIPGFSCSYLV